MMRLPVHPGGTTETGTAIKRLQEQFEGLTPPWQGPAPRYSCAGETYEYCQPLPVPGVDGPVLSGIRVLSLPGHYDVKPAS